MRFIVPVGRALFVAIFISSFLGHFSQRAIDYAAESGVPAAEMLVPVSGVIALVGALSILLGYHARVGGWLLVLFLVPVTLTMHNFWAEKDAASAQMEYAMFMKNLSMLGGALLISYFGAGPLSLDAWLKTRSKKDAEPAS
jgi:putative oxidoreductase